MTAPFPKCGHCPARDLARPCLAQATRHPRYCELVDPESPEYRPEYVAMLAGAEVPTETPMPGVLAQAVTYTTALARHIAAGSPEAPADVAAARLAICRECPMFVPDGSRCRACGCYMEIKATWADASCPLAEPKWGPVTSAPPSDPVAPGRTDS